MPEWSALRKRIRVERGVPERDILIQQIVGDPTAISHEEMDALPFGAIEVDRRGKVVFFNGYEERKSGKQRVNVLGRNFFRDVAPCASVESFQFAFQRAAHDQSLNERFDFEFRFPDGRYRKVDIWMTYSKLADGAWIFISDIK
jgi:photoactive yellow protein